MALESHNLKYSVRAQLTSANVKGNNGVRIIIALLVKQEVSTV
jgi:hypothetical protein